jgi:serine/threonine protein kinase
MSKQHITLPVGVTIRDPHGAHYTIEGLMGTGEFGALYLVRDRRFSRPFFGLKELIDPSPEDRARFTFEGEILMRLRHPALPRVHRVFEHEQLRRVYLVLDYIVGRDLEALRREQADHRFAFSVAFPLLAPIADALSYLHMQDPPVVHRDVRPANIIVPAGTTPPMLVNFGIAKQQIAGRTTAVIRRGTPGYAAPEQYTSGTSAQTDIYGLGATLYTLLTGIIPPDAVSRVLRGQGTDPLKPARLLLPGLPGEISEAIGQAMAPSAAERFATIEQFWRILAEHVGQQPVQLPSVLLAPARQFHSGQRNSYTPPVSLPYPQQARQGKGRVPLWNRVRLLSRKILRLFSSSALC